jgi:putative ABC transport system permease protein
MSGFLNDLRFGLRQLATKPGFATAAILTLALGIGANTAVFSVLSGYLFKPLPYPDGAQLVQVNVQLPKIPAADALAVSPPLYRMIQRQTNAFSTSAVYHQHDFNLHIGGRAKHVSGAIASASLFAVLDVRPLLGHVFTTDNMHAGRDHVAVISYQLWRTSFGGNAGVIGKTVKLAGERYRIIGVMPKNFAFPDRSAGVWVPLRVNSATFSPSRSLSLNLSFIGRLKPGVEVDDAATRIQQAARAYRRNVMPDRVKKILHKTGFRLAVRPYHQVLLGDRPASLWLLEGAVLLVLLMTCVNVANLLLSRILGRSHELAMRSALGATRAALVRQLLAEGLCLTVPGGLIGVGLFWLALRALASSPLGPGDSIFNIALDWRVALFALGAVLFTAALISVLPIRHLAHTDLQGSLQEGGRSAGGGRRTVRVRNALVIAELTLATGLLAMAGLVLHSFMNIEAVNPGFRKDHVLIARLLVSPTDHPGSEKLRHFYTELVQRVDALPGVRHAAVAQSLPLGGASNLNAFSILGRKPPASARPPTALFNSVSQGYFKTLGIPVLRGRRFDDRDKGTTHAIVGTQLVKRYLSGSNPIGQTIVMGGMKHVIIGVVPSIKYAKLSQTQPSAVIYVNGPKMPPTRQAQLVVHTELAPSALAKPVQRLVASIDPHVSVYGVHTMHQQIDDGLRSKQRTMALLLTFGGIALALAIVGVYAVMSYAVGQRRAECGVRLALGALPGDLQWLVLKDGLKLLAVGLAIGLGLAVLFGYLISARLFGVMPFDPVTLIGSAIVLCAITLAACYLPARRAAKLDPAIAMMEQ